MRSYMKQFPLFSCNTNNEQKKIHRHLKKGKKKEKKNLIETEGCKKKKEKARNVQI